MLTLFVVLAACAPSLTGDPAAGQTLFDDNCAACHGTDGTGGSGPDITGSASGDIEDAVTNGKETMPAFPDFSEQDLADVVAYIEQDL